LEKNDLLLVGFLVLIGFSVLFFINYERLSGDLLKCKGNSLIIDTLLNKAENVIKEQANVAGKQKDLLNQSNIMIYNPSLNLLENFLKLDNTSEYKYTSDFRCSSFSSMLVNHLRNHHIFGCMTSVWFFDGKGHSIVAVNTSDYGVVFVEPQSDKIIMNLTPGQNYCDRVGWVCKDKADWKIEKIIDCFGTQEMKNNTIIQIW